MATNPTSFLLHTLFLILTLTYFINYKTATAAAAFFEIQPSLPCNGSIAECNEDLEMVMDSEINRRFIQEKRQISYGTLNKDQPVCQGGEKGAAYSASGCVPRSSNPYHRGCSPTYGCRKDA